MLKSDDQNSRAELNRIPNYLGLKRDNKFCGDGGGSFDGPVTTISATSDHLPPPDPIARGHALDREAREGVAVSHARAL